MRLYGGRGEIAREVFVSYLREYGPLTNSELAEVARLDANLWLFGSTIYPHMLKLERQGRVTRIQRGRGHTILWTVPGAEAGSVPWDQLRERYAARLRSDADRLRERIDRLREQFGDQPPSV